MDAEFWLRRWERGDIGFHESEANPLLVAHFAELSMPAGTRVFLPLCGKTLAIGWLLRNGYRVVGAELSETAIEQLFEELGATPRVTEAGNLKHYSAAGLDIFVGDIFAVDRTTLGPVDAIFDRAALTALPPAMRARYAPHLVEITDSAPQLLITYAYDQTQMNGPPFATSEADIRQLYGAHYSITLLAEGALEGRLRAVAGAVEQVWLLERR